MSIVNDDDDISVDADLAIEPGEVERRLLNICEASRPNQSDVAKYDFQIMIIEGG